MKIKRHDDGRPNLLFWILLGSLLLWSCSASPSLVPTLTVSPPTLIPSTSTATLVPTPTRQPGPWQIVGIYSADHSIMTAGFLNEQVAATGGMLGQMAYSNDSALDWLVTEAHSDCRYGIEVVSPQVIWTWVSSTCLCPPINSPPCVSQTRSMG